MNIAVAHKYDDTAPLPTATRARVVTFAAQAANDRIYYIGSIQLHPTHEPHAFVGRDLSRRFFSNRELNRVSTVTNSGADELTTYAFDANDRLTRVSYPDQQTAYTFDANANRTSETTIASGNTTLHKTYTYNTRNQLTRVTDSITPANDAQYAFDANGNQTRKTQGTTQTDYTYDVKDQLLSVSRNTANLGLFSYDYQGHRIVKDMGGSIVRYAYDGNSVLLETDTSGSTLAKFDYGPDRLLSMTHASEGRAYYLFDALGSVANLTTSAGAIQARYQYDAYGNYRNTDGASFNRFGFTGHEKDNETNLYYFKARYYDPDTGRFLNQDAYLGDVNTPPSLHRHLYAYGNPTVYVDLDGYKSVFGDATDQLDDFKDWLGERNKESDSGIAAVGIGTAQFATTLGQAMTGGLNLAANLAQKAVGVDDQQVRDELGAVGNAIGKSADFVVNGNYAQAAKNVHQAAVDETSKAMSGDVTATANLTQVAWGMLTARGGATELGAAGKTLAANTGKAVDAVSAKIANAGQAVRNVLTREGGKLDVAESLAPSAQRSVVAKPSAPIQETPKFEQGADANRYFTNKTEYQAPSEGTGNKYTVHQQEIDPDLFIPTRGKTNAELMQNGGAPYVEKDGRLTQINLHHSRQNAKGSLFEISTITHQAKSGAGAEALHPYKTIRGRELNGDGSGPANSRHPSNPVDRSRFDIDRDAYWKDRYENLMK